MTNEWRDFLTRQGAQIDNGTVLNFGDPSAELQPTLTGDILCDLSHLGLFKASGDDTRDFLQGQLSNDIRHIDATHSQLSTYNSPKGRMLAIFRVFERGGDIYLQMPAEILPQTMKRLGMFILRAKVSLSDVSGELGRIGLSGPNSEQLLGQHIASLPQANDEVVSSGEFTVIRIAGPQPRFEVVGTYAAIQQLWSTLAGAARPAGHDSWALLDIHAGIPTVYTQTVEAFVPQMANLQLINGVNFKKGCYPGQEIVARMQYLGKLKRRMYMAHTDAEQCPAPGDELYSESSSSGQGTGRVVDARANPDGGYDLLVIGEISSIEEGTVQIHDATGPQLNFERLPYSFEPV